MSAVISATGLWTPKNSISNEELVVAFNKWSDQWNTQHAEAITSGEVEAKPVSSAEFIEKASGIKSRYVISKDPILDPDVMAPRIPERPDEDMSILAEISVAAAKSALAKAGRNAQDVDAIIVACSNLQRAYPAIAIEVQDALGAGGFAFDMNVACSSATFGIETARGLIAWGSGKISTGLQPRNLLGTFKLQRPGVAILFLEMLLRPFSSEDESIAPDGAWEILGSKLATQFSNNIRNNFGFLNNAAPEGISKDDKLFIQNGRKVFREVVPLVAGMITEELAKTGVRTTELKRMWLHQANLSMNTLIAKKSLEHFWGQRRGYGTWHPSS